MSNIFIFIVIFLLFYYTRNCLFDKYYYISIKINDNIKPNFNNIVQIKPGIKYVMSNKGIYCYKNNKLIKNCNSRILKIVDSPESIIDIISINSANPAYFNYDDVYVLRYDGIYYYKNTFNNGFDMYKISDFKASKNHCLIISEIKNKFNNEHMKTNINKNKFYGKYNFVDINYNSSDYINCKLQKFYVDSPLNYIFDKYKKHDINYGRIDSPKIKIYYTNSNCEYIIYSQLENNIYALILNNNSNNNINFYDVEPLVDNFKKYEIEKSHEEILNNLKFNISCKDNTSYKDNIQNTCNVEINPFKKSTSLHLSNKFIGITPLYKDLEINHTHIKLSNNKVDINSKIIIFMNNNEKIIINAVNNQNNILSIVNSYNDIKYINICDMYNTTYTILKPNKNTLYTLF